MTRGDLPSLPRETKLMAFVGKHLDDPEFASPGANNPNSPSHVGTAAPQQPNQSESVHPGLSHGNPVDAGLAEVVDRARAQVVADWGMLLDPVSHERSSSTIIDLGSTSGNSDGSRSQGKLGSTARSGKTSTLAKTAKPPLKVKIQEVHAEAKMEEIRRKEKEAVKEAAKSSCDT